MIIYINERREIKDVNKTSNPDLKEIYVDDEMFKGWSVAKIVCYAVYLTDNDEVCGFYPYVDSRIVEQLDHLDHEKQEQITDLDERAEIAEEQVTNLEFAVVDVYESTDTMINANQDQITNLELAVVELYEIIGG